MRAIIAAFIVAGAILLAGEGISVTLDEVCPTVEEGTQFLHARTS